MRRPLVRWLWGGLLLALLLAPGTIAAIAQEGEKLPAAVVAVVDYQRLLKESKAARAVRTEIENRRKRYREELRKQEQELLQQERELTRQRGVLSPAAYAKKRKEFERRAAEVQRQVQKRRRELDAVAAEAYARIREVIIRIMGELAEQRGLNLVLPSSAVLLFSPRIDLTAAVLEQLDARLPSVEVPAAPPE